MKHTIYPSSKNVFRAYRLTPPTRVKVCLIAQDPYPHSCANGLAFSSDESMEEIPRSLQNIFEEVNNDIGYQPYHNPNLERWAKQGVFLLNTSLTVRENQPGSHRNIGWRRFTDKTIEIICKKNNPVVFLLWGKQAQYFAHKISKPHRVIYSAHPSPFSAHRGFFGSKPFSRANEILKENYNFKINWLDNE